MASAGRRLYANDDPATPASTTSLLPPSARGNYGGAQGAARTGTNGGPPNLRSKASATSLSETPYSVVNSPVTSSISDKFSLSPDPSSWGAAIDPSFVEPDDYLHNPDPRRDRKLDEGGTVFTGRGLVNLGCLSILGLGLLTLFAAYPFISHFTKNPLSTLGGFNVGGTNASGQVATSLGGRGLIDKDTTHDLYTKPSYIDGSDLELVFSDEFNQDGRTFYPGDDPYWEAVDLHYWGTNNLNWYSPDTLTTKDGALSVVLKKEQTHGMNFSSGMMSTWNKFCFTGGLLEASVTLPGANNVLGLWPAVWAMGNLGRAGFGASLDGTWPYTYDACDVGTVKNQTKDGSPKAATVNGDKEANGALSYLPGQRLSRCTCPGESHPGPVHSDGSYVGRAAPEIDVFEAQVSGQPLTGQVSQSGQWAPFNAGYQWFNTSDTMMITDPRKTILNPYMGGAFQQATSGVTETNQDCYELTKACFSVYGFEYKPGFDNAYIGWISDNKLAWRLNSGGMAADTQVQISARPVPQEPMYLIINLGMSQNFGFVDLDHLTFPTVMKIDYIRVYQRPDSKNIGCNPKDFPTQSYIERYIEAYTNPNLTTWTGDYGQTFPKNRFLGEC